jgi:hypothetical protein
MLRFQLERRELLAGPFLLPMMNHQLYMPRTRRSDSGDVLPPLECGPGFWVQALSGPERGSPRLGPAPRLYAEIAAECCHVRHPTARDSPIAVPLWRSVPNSGLRRRLRARSMQRRRAVSRWGRPVPGASSGIMIPSVVGATSRLETTQATGRSGQVCHSAGPEVQGNEGHKPACLPPRCRQVPVP